MPFDARTVARDLGAELGEDIEPEDVDEDDFFGETVYKYDTGNREYMVFEDEESAYRAAVEYVKQDLEEQPEIFNQDWLMGHIDEKKLRDWVYAAVMEDPYVEEIAQYEPDRFWEEAEYWGISIPDEEDRGDDVDDDYVEALKEAIAEDRAKDPMDWLGDIYPEDEAVKKAMEVAGIDIEAAAEEAVSTDGWPHFLSYYDGHAYGTKSDFAYVRLNKAMKPKTLKKKTPKAKASKLKNKLLR